MKTLALLIGLFIIVFGVVGILAPYSLLTIGQYSVTPIGLYLVAALRVGIGLVLLRVARSSRFPNLLRVFGAIALIAGLTTPVLGVDRARAILNWWTAQGVTFMRLPAVLALALGGFIVYAVVAGRRADLTVK